MLTPQRYKRARRKFEQSRCGRRRFLDHGTRPGDAELMFMKSMARIEFTSLIEIK
jgi:hypothetical protein